MSDVYITQILVQRDDKIVVVGNFYDLNGINVSDAIFRLNSNGSLDKTFSLAGAGAGPVGQNFSIHTVVETTNGSLIIGGEFTTFHNFKTPYHLARIFSNGKIDTTFNPINLNTGKVIQELAIQADGKLIIVSDSIVARLKM